jgi:signal transduction histidine kinase
MRLFLIILVFILGGSASVFAQRYQSIMDSLLVEEWIHCKMMQPVDISSIEKQHFIENSKESYLTLGIIKELKEIFDREQYVYGLTPEKYANNMKEMKAFFEEAQEKNLHHVCLQILRCIQIIYEYGLEYEKSISTGEQGINYYNNLSKKNQKTIKLVDYDMYTFSYHILLNAMNQQKYDLVDKYSEMAIYWGEEVYRKSDSPKSDFIAYVNPLKQIGLYHGYKGEIDSAMYFFDIAIKETKKQEHLQMLVSLYFSKGEILYRVEEYDKALAEVIEALDLSEQMNWDAGRFLALSVILDIQESLNNTSKIMYFSKKLLALYEKTPEIRLEMQNNVFNRLSKYYELREQLDSAIVFAGKGLKINSEIGSANQTFFSHIRLYNLYKKTEELEKSNIHFNKASGIASMVDWEGLEVAIMLCELGNYSLEKEDFKKAIIYGQEAFEMATKFESNKSKVLAARLLCEGYVGLNEVDSARKYIAVFDAIKDSLAKSSQDSVTLDLQEKYEVKEKEKEIKQLGQEKELAERLNQIYIKFGLILFFVLLLVVYLYRKQKQTSVELKELQYTKDELFSIIAHDLRTPFSVLMNFSENLEQDLEHQNFSKLKSSLQSIRESSSNAYFLFEDLLGWTKTQTRKLTFEPTVLSLEQSVKESLGLLKSMIEFKNIAVHSQLKYNWVTADSYMLNTIFRNLITNAIKFLNINGELEISSKKQGAFVTIEIRDNGKGMDKKTLQSILEQKDKQKGLGMILCKQFVLKNGGKIGIDSTLGQGTIAWFSLPIAEAPTGSNSIQKEEVRIDSKELVILSLKTQKELLPFVLELKKLKVFYATEVYQVLEKIKEMENTELEYWLELMDKSIKVIDADLYTELLNHAELKNKI